MIAIIDKNNTLYAIIQDDDCFQHIVGVYETLTKNYPEAQFEPIVLTKKQEKILRKEGVIQR